jgi:hypothetical protein
MAWVQAVRVPSGAQLGVSTNSPRAAMPRFLRCVQANEELWLNITGTVAGDIQYAYGAVAMQIWELGVAVGTPPPSPYAHASRALPDAAAAMSGVLRLIAEGVHEGRTGLGL